MNLRVFIIDTLQRLSPGELAVLEEITAARYEQFASERAKYIPANPNTAIAARLAQDSGPACKAVVIQHAGSVGPEKPALTHEQIDREADARLAEFRKRHPGFCEPTEDDYPQDDGDIQPYERTTTYPWGER